MKYIPKNKVTRDSISAFGFDLTDILVHSYLVFTKRRVVIDTPESDSAVSMTTRGQKCNF